MTKNFNKNIHFQTLIIVFSAVLSGFGYAGAQSVKYYPNANTIKVLNETGDSLRSAWAGGFLNPMFSNIDLNGDGIQDLFVYEPSDEKVFTFLNTGNGNFIYAPAYEAAFPSLTNWAFLIDYNNDGKADIFAYSHFGGGIEVYKNESSGGVLKFRLVSELLTYPPQNINIYASPIDIPAITDVDGDGDIDILSLDVLQSDVIFYKNLSVEKFGKPDSLSFDVCDYCWGKFQQPAIDNIPVLGRGCGPRLCKTNVHGGFTMLALDMDGDGDKDLIQGDMSSANLIMLRNGKTQNGQNAHPVDSMVAVDSIFPGNSVRPNLPAFLVPMYVDVNNDGKRDLLVTPLDGAANINQVLLYRNTGSDNSPVFEFAQYDFLQDQMIDLGRRAAPAFFDYNGDGLEDMVVATLGDYRETRHLYERLVLYKNVGTAANAVFRVVHNDYLSLSIQKMLGLSPTFADLDGDGVTDLLLGKNDGTLSFYKNTAAAGQEASFVLTDAEFAGIDVGQQSTPVIIDLDRDGLPDLIIGEQAGNINYYKNTGSGSFTLITDSLGKIKTNRPYYEYIYDNTTWEIIDSVLRYEREGLSAPAVADVDGDGKYDLVTGSFRGELHFYSNIEDNPEAKIERSLQLLQNPNTNTYENKSFGKLSMPVFSRLSNQDSLPKLVVGNERGGLFMFGGTKENITSISKLPEPYKTPKPVFRMFPNPATSHISITSVGNENPLHENNKMELQMINMLGQNILNKIIMNAGSVDEQIDISSLRKGIYIIRICDSQGLMVFSEKLIIE